MKPIGIVGVVVTGQHKGWTIRVVDELEKTGGYRIVYTEKCPIGEKPRVYHHWVLPEKLNAYFDSSDLEVRWEKE